jgi:GT2 family glycosyltransferase
MINRNNACRCGSGLRFKNCCGALSASSTASPAPRELGLQKHLAGELFDAVACYEAAIAINASDWDVLHMRATTLYQLGLLDEAREAFAALVATPLRDSPGFWKNYGLVLAACANEFDEVSMFELRRDTPMRMDAAPSVGRSVDALEFDTRERSDQGVRVAVVMPVYNHAAFVASSIESVLAQTHLPDEMIVIDDGSSDDSVRVAREALARAPFSVRLIARDNRGAHATLNEAIELATCEWIQPINSDDRLPPRRIERCIAQIAAHPKARWGYMRVECIDTNGKVVSSRWDNRCSEIYRVQDSAANTTSHANALMLGNASISTGNLFFRKTLWQSVRGFAAYRYNHDWDFCLRASRLIEPVVINELGYLYRVHEHNTIRESAEKARAESQEILSSHFSALMLAAQDEHLALTECVEIAYAMNLTGSGPLIAAPSRDAAAFAHLISGVRP